MRWLMLHLSMAAILLSQQPTGTIGGTITDIDSRAVPKMPVQATNAATKAVYKGITSATGEYSISQLPAGTYQVAVQAPAVFFKPFVRDNVQVAPGQAVKLDIRLEEGIQLNTLGDGRDFFTSIPRPVPPTGPTPRLPDGKPDLSGYWAQAAGAGDPGAPPAPPDLTDWARSVTKERQANDLKDLPSVRCLPNGVVFSITAGFAQKFVYTPTLLIMLSEGQPTRQVFLDGRGHPADPNPTWLGHSVGRWEQDTLVVDTVGFNDKTWLDLSGVPQTERLHVVERYRRPDLGHLELDLTVEDPSAFKSPWRLKRNYSLNPTEEVMESLCNENEKDAVHIK